MVHTLLKNLHVSAVLGASTLVTSGKLCVIHYEKYALAMTDVGREGKGSSSACVGEQFFFVVVFCGKVIQTKVS